MIRTTFFLLRIVVSQFVHPLHCEYQHNWTFGLHACIYMSMNSLTHLQVFPSHRWNTLLYFARKHKSSSSAVDSYLTVTYVKIYLQQRLKQQNTSNKTQTKKRRTMIWNKLLIVGTCLVLFCSLELSAACQDYGSGSSRLCTYIGATSGAVGHGWTCSDFCELRTAVSYKKHLNKRHCGDNIKLQLFNIL